MPAGRPKRIRNPNPVRETEKGYTRRFNRGGVEGKRDRKFGLAPGDRDFMHDYQQGQCGICQRHESEFTRKLAVDHCHETGRVRGLLCGPCNTALGLLSDDRQRLERAIRWLMTTEEAEASNG